MRKIRTVGLTVAVALFAAAWTNCAQAQMFPTVVPVVSTNITGGDALPPGTELVFQQPTILDLGATLQIGYFDVNTTFGTSRKVGVYTFYPMTGLISFGGGTTKRPLPRGAAVSISGSGNVNSDVTAWAVVSGLGAIDGVHRVTPQ